MLVGLVFCGILLPLLVVLCYMRSSTKFAGPNRIMQETLHFYFHSKYSVKEQQVRGRLGGQGQSGGEVGGEVGV